MALPPPPRLPHNSTDAYNNKFQSVTNLLQRNTRIYLKITQKYRFPKINKKPEEEEEKRNFAQSQKTELCALYNSYTYLLLTYYLLCVNTGYYSTYNNYIILYILLTNNILFNVITLY